jgi:hypothetical protein
LRKTFRSSHSLPKPITFAYIFGYVKLLLRLTFDAVSNENELMTLKTLTIRGKEMKKLPNRLFPLEGRGRERVFKYFDRKLFSVLRFRDNQEQARREREKQSHGRQLKDAD